MTDVMSNEILEMCRSHFNEPLIAGSGLARLVGYGEDDMDCYLICRFPEYPNGKTIWHTAVGGYVFLDRLAGQGRTLSWNGDEWDDLLRLDNLLSLNGAPKADEFRIVLHHSQEIRS